MPQNEVKSMQNCRSPGCLRLGPAESAQEAVFHKKARSCIDRLSESRHIQRLLLDVEGCDRIRPSLRYLHIGQAVTASDAILHETATDFIDGPSRLGLVGFRQPHVVGCRCIGSSPRCWHRSEGGSAWTTVSSTAKDSVNAPQRLSHVQTLLPDEVACRRGCWLPRCLRPGRADTASIASIHIEIRVVSRTSTYSTSPTSAAP